MYEGWTVPMDYDPLLAKLIGYGTDRVGRAHEHRSPDQLRQPRRAQQRAMRRSVRLVCSGDHASERSGRELRWTCRSRSGKHAHELVGAAVGNRDRFDSSLPFTDLVRSWKALVVGRHAHCREDTTLLPSRLT